MTVDSSYHLLDFVNQISDIHPYTACILHYLTGCNRAAGEERNEIDACINMTDDTDMIHIQETDE